MNAGRLILAKVKTSSERLSGFVLRIEKLVLGRLAVGCLLLTAIPATAAAESVTTCHCFQQRQYSPTQPKAFDSYLLATMQNRLLAHTFEVPRGEIVKAKMGGRTNARLWVAYALARSAGVPPASIFAAYDRKGSWQAVVRQYPPDPELLGSALFAGLARNADDAELAWLTVTDILGRNFGATPAELAALGRITGSLQETILATLLAQVLHLPLEEVPDRQRTAGSWGHLMAEAGLTLEQLDRLVFSGPAGSKPQ